MAALPLPGVTTDDPGGGAPRCPHRRGRPRGPDHRLPGPRTAPTGRPAPDRPRPAVGPALQRADRLRPTGVRAAAAAHRGIDGAEETAGDTSDLRRPFETGGEREALPGTGAERVRHPRVAAVGVVLHDDERGARLEVGREPGDRLDLAVTLDEVE